MGFRRGAYARIWQSEDKGKYSVCRMSISQRDKDTGEYEQVFSDGFVKLIGTAHELIKRENVPQGKDEDFKGLSVQLLDCDVTTNYDSDKKVMYTNYAVFDMIVSQDKQSSNKSSSSGKKSKTATKKKKSDPESEENNEIEETDIISDDDLPF